MKRMLGIFLMALTLFASGAAHAQIVAFGFWSPPASELVYTFSGDSTTVVLSSLFSPAQWSSATAKRVVIPAGVTIGSTVTTTAALRTGTGWGGSLTLSISGAVDGAGGIATSTVGGTGGDAILANQAGLVIVGNGSIRAGGGAGGKGGNGSATVTQGPSYVPGGPDYYSWADIDGSQTNIYWAATSGPTYLIYGYVGSGSYAAPDGWTYYRGSWGGQYSGWNYIYRQQASGTVSGNAGRGRGHDGANTNGVAGGTNSGLSGNGGDWGASGTAGASGNAGGGFASGLAGFSINGTVDVSGFTGTRLGR